MPRNVPQLIAAYNEGRNPDLLALKYQDMRSNLFKFYRGTAHLFYKDTKRKAFLLNSPLVWACGDLHFENFGSYKGDNGLVYFDINDFDEAALAPCLFDVARFVVSLLLIAELEGFTKDQAYELCVHYLQVYCHTLATGNSRWVEKQTAHGVVKQLLENVETRRPLYKKYSNKVKGTRQFDFSHEKILPPSAEEKRHILEIIRNWHLSTKAKNIYEIVDIAFHIKGSGSLGIKRYMLLVKKRINGRHALVDLKMSTPSCLTSYLKTTQPEWSNEAERTIEIQKRVQGTSQALLEHIETKECSFVLREYQSHEDKVRFCTMKGKIEKVKEVIMHMAQATAWGQLQSSGRQGSHITDQLIEFAIKKEEWIDQLLKFSKSYVKQVKADYEAFLVSQSS